VIQEHAYWMDRDSRYRLEWTESIQANGKATVTAVNKLLALAEADGIVRDTVSSGWRPQSVNDATKNAGKTSKHITAQACDIFDPDRALAQWCVNHPDRLAECGLWCEDFRWTPTWVHFQRVPPKSGKRIFIPSSAPPKAPALEGQKPIPDRIRT
jgi:hypothetical protein